MKEAETVVESPKVLKFKIARKEGTVFHQHIACASAKLFSHSKFCVCSAPLLPASRNLCITHVFLERVIKNICLLPAWHTSAMKCLCKCKSTCEDVSLALHMNEAHYPWNICRANKRDLHSVTCCCEPDTENNIYLGFWERFRCHEDVSGWISLTLVCTSFRHFSAAATIGRQRRGRGGKQLSENICPYVVILFFFTLVYSTLLKAMVRLGLFLVFFWTFRKSSHSGTNSTCSNSQSKGAFCCN